MITPRILRPTILAGLFVVLPAAIQAAGGEMAIETWGVGAKASHPRTLTISDVGHGAAVIRVDLSALSAGARVYRARLLVSRQGLDGAPEGILAKNEILPLTSANRDGGRPVPAEQPLPVSPPWYNHFDASDVVRSWLADTNANHGLYVRSLPGWRPESTRLEIAYDGRSENTPPQVSGLKVFHRSGQTFITFKEIEDPFGARPVTWGTLRERLARMDESRLVRYRIYRHTRLINGDSIHEATLLAEVKPLSGFNVNSWSKERLINQVVFGDDDLGALGKYGPFAGWDRDSPQGGRLVIPRFVVAEGQGPLAPGTGLYVHSAAKAEKAHYAVVTSINGTANTIALSPANSLAEGIEEKPGEWEPVLQGTGAGEFGFDFPGEKRFYVTWVAPPLSNLPSRSFNWSVHLPPDVSKPAPLDVSFHDLGFSYAKPIRRYNRVAIQIAGHDFAPVSGWYGYHESLGTLRSWRDGRVQPYTERRIQAFIDWAERTWKIDRRRGFTDGRGLGATGAIHFACKHPDLFAYVLADQGAVHCRDSTHLPALEAAWGRVDWAMPNDQGINVWDWQDLTWYVRTKGPAYDLPVLAISPRGHTAWEPRYPRRVVGSRTTRWMQSHRDFTALFKALLETRHMVFADFDWGPSLAILPQWMDVTTGPVPVFTNSSDVKIKETEDGPSIFFEPSGSSPSGWIHWHHRWGGEAVDQPDRLELTVSVTGGSEVKADVTPRRATRFRPKPGTTFTWTNTCLAEGENNWALRNIWKKYPAKKAIQTGTVTADEHGLVTLKGVIILPTKNRIVIHR